MASLATQFPCALTTTLPPWQSRSSSHDSTEVIRVSNLSSGECVHVVCGRSFDTRSSRRTSMISTSPIHRPASRMEITDCILINCSSWIPSAPRSSADLSQFVNDRCRDVERNASSGLPSKMLWLITLQELSFGRDTIGSLTEENITKPGRPMFPRTWTTAFFLQSSNGSQTN